MSLLEDRIRALEERILRACADCRRDPHSVELLPVSKRQPSELIRAADGLGFRTFGENYVQEGVAKALEMPGLDFVLIGPLQRNKAKPALEHFREIMTVDRPELAQRLVHIAGELGVSRQAWLQVDLWDEATKMGGCTAAGIAPILEALGQSPTLAFKGFLAIPPPGFSQAFHDLSRLREEWQQKLGRKVKLSMGMSDDLEEAIAAGSDQVRIGTAFFGVRH